MAREPSAEQGNTAVPERSPGGRGPVTRWLTHNVWVGVAGILTAASVVIALVAYCDPPKDASPPPQNQISGDCNAQGTGNTITCQTP